MSLLDTCNGRWRKRRKCVSVCSWALAAGGRGVSCFPSPIHHCSQGQGICLAITQQTKEEDSSPVAGGLAPSPFLFHSVPSVVGV